MTDFGRVQGPPDTDVMARVHAQKSNVSVRSIKNVKNGPKTKLNPFKMFHYACCNTVNRKQPD